MKSVNVVVSVLAGIAAGTVAGLLLAPEKGEKTRKQILDKGEDYAHSLKDKFDETVGDIAKGIKSIVHK